MSMCDSYSGAASQTGPQDDDLCECECKVMVDGEKCGETHSLQIVKEFKRLYEDKMKEIDRMACGDHEQAKISLQQDWIRDLTEQNELLVRAVEELELEATERVQMLEAKLQNTCAAASEVMKRYKDFTLAFNLDETFQRANRLQSDVVNLVEFIKRARDHGVWDSDGLNFYTVTNGDLYGDGELNTYCTKYSRSTINNKLMDKLEEKEKSIKELQAKIESFSKFGDVEELYKKIQDGDEKSKKLEQMKKKLDERENIIKDLESKIELIQATGDGNNANTELQNYKDKVEELHQYMLEMRNALTAEVAEKHDTIITLRRNIQHLEEQCQQAAKQTQFKDDIIKELRKELKQLKREDDKLSGSCYNYSDALLQKELCALRKENELLKNDMKITKHELEVINERANEYLNEKEMVEHKHRDSLKKIDELSICIRRLKEDAAIQEKDSLNELQCLKEQTEKFKNELENTRRNSQIAFEELRKAMIEDLESFDRKNSEKHQIIQLLQNELREEKEHHRKSIDRIVHLNNENRDQHEMIEKLQCTIKECNKKTTCSNACTNTETPKRVDRGLSVTPHTADAFFNHPPEELRRHKTVQTSTKEGEQLEHAAENVSHTVSRLMTASKDQIAKLEAELANVNNKLQLIHNKDEIIKIQNETLNIIQIELQALRDKEREVEAERGRRGQEIINLKKTIAELEKALQNAQERSANLQNAVDLYLNSINVLEASEERAKIEIEQQRKTIVNLQDALIGTKQELDKFRQKTTEDLQRQFETINDTFKYIIDRENFCKQYEDQIYAFNKTVTRLRDINLDLEVEKVQFLNDISTLEDQVQVYKHTIKNSEDCICELKAKLVRLQREKIQYESIIKYLKEEMRTLADQLCGLQKLLNTANATTFNENAEMMQNIKILQETNDELQNQLNLVGQQLIHENKINEANARYIGELQQEIQQKNSEIEQWSVAYEDIKTKLETAKVQNKELHSSFMEIQMKIDEYEQEQLVNEKQSDSCKKEIVMCKENLSGLREKMNILKQLLSKKTDECKQLKADLEAQNKISQFVKSECENIKNHYEQNIADLKETIKDLNEKLKKHEQTSAALNEEMKAQQVKLIEFAEREAKHQQDYAERERELTEKLYQTQSEEVRLIDLITQLECSLSTIKDQVHVKDEQLQSIRSNLEKLKGGKCTQMMLVQEELATLKEELNTSLQLQSKLKAENEKLRSQIAQSQANMTACEQRNQIISEQLDQCLLEIQRMQSEKETLDHQNEELRQELQSLQNAFSNLSREYRNKTKSMINLEMELVDSKTNQFQLCDESRKVVTNVYAWLKEQKQLNCKLTRKIRSKNELIQKLKNEKQLLLKQIGAGTCQQCQCGDTQEESSFSEGGNEWSCTFEYTEIDDVEPDGQVWINRVENMTDQLQRSNKYWQTKINENDYMVTRDQ